MAKLSNLLELDVNKLFEEKKIDDIVAVSALLDAEIEKKRVELRSMVGDRYKDVLAASETIKNMEVISQTVFQNIQNMTETCEKLIALAAKNDKTPICAASPSKEQINERTLIAQVRLIICLNEELFYAFQIDDSLRAVEVLLLAQHIQTGIQLNDSKQVQKMLVLKHLTEHLARLKGRVVDQIQDKLSCSKCSSTEMARNLVAYYLLHIHRGSSDVENLYHVFRSFRRKALESVISGTYDSVRGQICALVQCVLETIRLMYDCFYACDNKDMGLVAQILCEFRENKETLGTLVKLALSAHPLDEYIPNITQTFHPIAPPQSNVVELANDWYEFATSLVQQGLNNHLELITTLKGLYIIHETASEIEYPVHWSSICETLKLSKNFNVWTDIFESSFTSRAIQLINLRWSEIVKLFQNQCEDMLAVIIALPNSELDLRSWVWSEGDNKLFAIKCKGYSMNVANFCAEFDEKMLSLHKDTDTYVNGNLTSEVESQRLKQCISTACQNTVTTLSNYLEMSLLNRDDPRIAMFCARMAVALLNVCPNFRKCCTSSTTWEVVCRTLRTSSTAFWNKWLELTIQKNEKMIETAFKDFLHSKPGTAFTRWDSVEIEEQTEESTSCKSDIRVPLNTSIILHHILASLNSEMCCLFVHTIPKFVHVSFIERHCERILDAYTSIINGTLNADQVNQKVALQMLFDVKFMTALCVHRDNEQLKDQFQHAYESLRKCIDPFDLNVFYPFIQRNVKKALVQSQVLFGNFLLKYSLSQASGPANGANESASASSIEPMMMAISTPALKVWFPPLPTTVPTKELTKLNVASDAGDKSTSNESINEAVAIPSSKSANHLFGGIAASDWFS